MLPTSLKAGRQAHFTPFFAPDVPESGTSGALWLELGLGPFVRGAYIIVNQLIKLFNGRS